MKRRPSCCALGLATDPGYDAFRSNYVQLFRQWSEHLCRSGTL